MNTCEYDIGINEYELCGKVCEGRTEYCAGHNRLIRKNGEDVKKLIEKLAQKFAKKPEPRSKPKPVSDKRKTLNEQYSKLVEEFKKQNPKCKAKVNEFCTKETDDVHHKKGRGVHLLDVDTFLPTCRSCHIWIENHPNEAKERGLSFSRLATIQTI